MINKQLLKRLEDVDELITSAIGDLILLDLDTADELDKRDIISQLEDAANIVWELQYEVKTL